MSGQVKPVILLLDPDLDFLEDMEKEAGTRPVEVISKIYSKRERVNIEDEILKHYPDIVVVNLDQDEHRGFADVVSDVLGVPTQLSPLVIGTSMQDSFTHKALAYKCGIDDYLVRPFKPKEAWFRLDVALRIRRLQTQLDEATRKLSQSNQELNISNRHLEEMTLTDELTGLNNMRFVTQFLEKQFHVFARFHRIFSIMMIDLDHFKEVNDQNDHLVGSETIRAVGHIIQNCTRGGDIKARYGGDEYIVAMPETDEVGAKVVAEKIRKAIEAYEIVGNEGKLFKVTGSIGIATYKEDLHKSYKDVIRDADYGLYTAKKSGRNCSVTIDSYELRKTSRDASYDETQSGVLSELKKLTK